MAARKRHHSCTRCGCMPALLAVLAAGCATSPADDGGTASTGAQAFSTYCSVCHALPHPKRHSYAEWQTLVGVMQQRMRERGMQPLDEQQRSEILAWLKHNSR